MAGSARRSATNSSAKKRRAKSQHQHNLSPLISAVASAAAAAHSFLSENDLHLLPSQTLSLESQITATSLSLSNLYSLLQPTPSLLSSPSPSSSNSICWFERLLSLASSERDTKWVEAFRMSKPSFDLLLRTLGTSLENSASNLAPDRVLGAALFRLAHGASYKAVGRRFGVDSGVACRCFYEVCKAVNDGLAHLLEFHSNLGGVLVGFGCGSLPNCCGVLGFSKFFVDGGEVGEDGSVIVQGLVDWEGRFMDVSAGWPGSIDPSTILRRSKLFSRVEELKELLNGPLLEVDGTLVPQYVLGDACCPLLQWLLTPFPILNRDYYLNFNEQAFNSIHSEGMKVVRTAFRRVRAQWRLLSMKWKKESVECLPFVVVTGCLLHNFLLKCGEVVVSDENEDDFGEWEFADFRGEGDERGESIRSALASHLGRVSKPEELKVVCE